MSVYLADVEFWHQLSTVVAFDNTLVAADAAQPLTEFRSGQRRRCRLLTG